MEVISLILNCLALLIAVVCLVLLAQEKKRNHSRNVALESLLRMDYDSVIACIGELKRDGRTEHEQILSGIEGLTKFITDLDNVLNGQVVTALKGCRQTISRIEQNVSRIGQKVDDLENGICPDYNAALATKESVDRFSEGVMNILCYGNPAPPKEAKEKDRENKD